MHQPKYYEIPQTDCLPHRIYRKFDLDWHTSAKGIQISVVNIYMSQAADCVIGQAIYSVLKHTQLQHSTTVDDACYFFVHHLKLELNKIFVFIINLYYWCVFFMNTYINSNGYCSQWLLVFLFIWQGIGQCWRGCCVQNCYFFDSRAKRVI